MESLGCLFALLMGGLLALVAFATLLKLLAVVVTVVGDVWWKRQQKWRQHEDKLRALATVEASGGPWSRLS